MQRQATAHRDPRSDPDGAASAARTAGAAWVLGGRLRGAARIDGAKNSGERGMD
ncbi:hypothetical protein [Sorangium atrum]|uniref:Uncharacterized protein n=1 Tax=Sorangium atrum TaxID=2995308 RepID=A0ABT5CD40_9BACT|nr:hypothetical protein [Sorangium aterium]MDC0684362.1 hypothetical protein [Sorangium aterium]